VTGKSFGAAGFVGLVQNRLASRGEPILLTGETVAAERDENIVRRLPLLREPVNPMGTPLSPVREESFPKSFSHHTFVAVRVAHNLERTAEFNLVR
jgi:hypothetical protein